LNESKISVRYAKAFFSSAVEKKSLEAAKKDVDLLLQLLQTQPRLKELLSSPVVKTSEKRVILDKIFADRLNKLSIDFLHFQALYSKLTGIKRAQLVTAVALDESQMQKFNKLIQVHFGGKAEVLTKVDEKLLGGFILRVDDHQLDSSVATQLKKMRRELVYVIKN
jgi:F-type H+-transporting ATPase subunit delta